ncbi:4090_t:CDS:10 [Entrophospora sp. SA101]|nr:4090_t:CDS:10 [Entrophospora sp. SA101]
MADNLISIEEGRPNNIEDDTARLLPDSDNQKKSTNSNTKRLVTSIIISIYIVWACIVLFVIRSGISEEAVASEEIHCSQIGVDVLKEGGSAMDATIATQLCIGTINAFSSVRDSNGTLETLDFREVAPLASYKTMFVKNPELAKFGGLSVGVPGEVLGMEIAHKRYGKLPWKRLFEPSIKLSREGFKVPSELANRLSYSAIYAPNGKLLGEGDLLIRKNYSDTLESIANNGSYPLYYNPIYDVVEDHGTTHISAIDKNNQSVSYTSTVNLVWGSRVMDPSTGIILNDEMDDFSIPGVTNYFGLKPSPFNFVEPKKKPLSSCLPVIIETDGQVETILGGSGDGQVETILGGSGGSRIISSVLLYILNIYDFDMNVLEAINQPRVHHQLVPNLVSVEADFSRLLLDQLILKGHNITMDEPFGYSQVQAIRKFKNGVIHAASDYRKNGVAAGY